MVVVEVGRCVNAIRVDNVCMRGGFGGDRIGQIEVEVAAWGSMEGGSVQGVGCIAVGLTLWGCVEGGAICVSSGAAGRLCSSHVRLKEVIRP